MNISKNIRRTFGEDEPERMFKEEALARLQKGSCPFTGEMASSNKFVHVGKYKIASTSYGVGLTGLTTQDGFSIEGFYVRCSEDFYSKQKAKIDRNRKLRWTLAISAIISVLVVVTAIIWGDDKYGEFWLIFVGTFFASMLPLVIMREKTKSHASRLSKMIVRRTQKHPHYGIPELQTGVLSVVAETDDIDEYIRMHAGR